MKMILKSLAAGMLILACNFAFSSFTVNKGGEGFEIYLNSKLVIQKFGNDIKTISSFSIDRLSNNDQLKVRYYHCGRIGRGRIIQVKNERNNVLREWKFTNAAQPGAFMILPVKDIVSIKRNNVGSLNLYYSSSELSVPRLLVKIKVSSGNITSR